MREIKLEHEAIPHKNPNSSRMHRTSFSFKKALEERLSSFPVEGTVFTMIPPDLFAMIAFYCKTGRFSSKLSPRLVLTTPDRPAQRPIYVSIQIWQ